MTKEEILKKVEASTNLLVLDEVMQKIRREGSESHAVSINDYYSLNADQNSLIDISITMDYINAISECGGDAGDYIDMMMGYARKEVNT